jgi:hypothetical protein
MKDGMSIWNQADGAVAYQEHFVKSPKHEEKLSSSHPSFYTSGIRAAESLPPPLFF